MINQILYKENSEDKLQDTAFDEATVIISPWLKYTMGEKKSLKKKHDDTTYNISPSYTIISM